MGARYHFPSHRSNRRPPFACARRRVLRSPSHGLDQPLCTPMHRHGMAWHRASSLGFIRLIISPCDLSSFSIFKSLLCSVLVILTRTLCSLRPFAQKTGLTIWKT
ncbi:hypothetical protein OPV22_030295 [Ensete ventricosum]|uniref:Uncharacterized protein n=1 Tax=Ensete ventricosum TaxID=4639 RepID=A0AAV8QBM8_ENSVE|nr:hypothetical protein OPV22_030295 [Ensete ventricosum]